MRADAHGHLASPLIVQLEVARDGCSWCCSILRRHITTISTLATKPHVVETNRDLHQCHLPLCSYFWSDYSIAATNSYKHELSGVLTCPPACDAEEAVSYFVQFQPELCGHQGT